MKSQLSDLYNSGACRALMFSGVHGRFYSGGREQLPPLALALLPDASHLSSQAIKCSWCMPNVCPFHARLFPPFALSWITLAPPIMIIDMDRNIRSGWRWWLYLDDDGNVSIESVKRVVCKRGLQLIYLWTRIYNYISLIYVKNFKFIAESNSSGWFLEGRLRLYISFQ